jgi:hypothetical protein
VATERGHGKLPELHGATFAVFGGHEPGTGRGAGEGALYPHGAGVEIKVRPPQAEELSAPGTGGDGHDEERFQGIVAGDFEQSPRLAGVERVEFLRPGGWGVYQARHVLRNHAPPMRLLQRSVQDRVEVPYGPRSAAFGELRGVEVLEMPRGSFCSSAPLNLVNKSFEIVTSDAKFIVDSSLAVRLGSFGNACSDTISAARAGV